ncbi:unnamed protein product, partial [Didymodactylos carnosus]
GLCLEYDKKLVQHLITEYVRCGSPVILDLIRNCSNECLDVLIEFIFYKKIQSVLIHVDNSTKTKRCLVIIIIEVLERLSSPELKSRYKFNKQLSIVPQHLLHLTEV